MCRKTWATRMIASGYARDEGYAETDRSLFKSARSGFAVAVLAGRRSCSGKRGNDSCNVPGSSWPRSWFSVSATFSGRPSCPPRVHGRKRPATVERGHTQARSSLRQIEASGGKISLSSGVRLLSSGFCCWTKAWRNYLPGKEDPKEISLRELRSARPAVLVFGSMTCPPFRGQLDGVDEVYEDFKDRAEFLFIYIREAHPDSVLSIVAEDGREALLQIRQAEDFPSRITSAAACQRSQELSLPIAVDDMDDSVGKAYSGWPNRMVVVGTDGNIAYATDPVPGGTNSQLPRAWLEKNLKADGG